MDDCESITVVRDTEYHINDEDSKHVDPQETKCGTAASESEERTDTAVGGANEENTEEERTKAAANESEACQKGSGLTENVNTVRKEEKDTEVDKRDEEVKVQPVKEQDNESGVNEEGKESNNESNTKENDYDKADDICVEEAKQTNDNESEGQTEKTEGDRDINEIKDDVQDKQTNLGKKRGTLSSALRAPTKSSVCPRAARPSARRDAMAKFQKDQTPGVRNFKAQQTSIGMAGGASIKQKILQWCRNKTQKYESVNIENFSSSWSDGLAFCALIHRFFPTAFDFSSLEASEREKNFTLAFSTAESLADCYPLLEVSDMLLMGKNPDPKCVFTYVQALCHHLSKIDKERKEKMEDKNKEKDCWVDGVHEQGDKEKDEKKEHEENQTDLNMKTAEETDQNENAVNAENVNEI